MLFIFICLINFLSLITLIGSCSNNVILSRYLCHSFYKTRDELFVGKAGLRQNLYIFVPDLKCKEFWCFYFNDLLLRIFLFFNNLYPDFEHRFLPTKRFILRMNTKVFLLLDRYMQIDTMWIFVIRLSNIIYDLVYD